MQRWLVTTIAILTLLIVGSCYAPPRGGVTPYPPGPIDTLSILFGNDYSRLCPQHFDYCRAGKHSICCPRGSCCDDGNGPYCCDSRGPYADGERYESREDYRDDRGERGLGPCGAHGTTCSRGGVTICCAENEGCCTDEQGLFCCSGRRSGY
jgi:hypothetical protein